MTYATNEPMADVSDMYMAHAMMRREFRLLPDLVHDVKPGDIARAQVLADHADKICLVLHLHHEGEDIVLWPLLLERGAEDAARIVPTMEKQHHGIEAALNDVNAIMPTWRSTAGDSGRLATALEVLRDRLVEHMAMEEREILPLAEKYVTAAEWNQLGEHGLKGSPKKDLPLTLGMVMYEGDPAVVKAVLANAPAPARLIMPLLAPRLYAKHAKRVHGTPTPPRVGRA